MAMQGTIVFKKRELLVPEDYLGKVLAARPDGLGYALHRFKEKTPSILLERGDGKYTIKDIMDIQNAAVDDELLLWFMLAGRHHLEDMQPFTCMGDETREEGPDIIGFADGSFPNFIPQASDHTNEYFLFNKYLIPKLNKLGTEPNGIFNAFADDLTKMELSSLGGHIVFLSSTGRIVPFGDGRQEFEWGWTTNAHGYAAPRLAEAVVETAKKVVGRMLVRKNDDRTTPARPIASVEPIPQPPKSDTAQPPPVEETKEYTFQPEPGTSRSDMKKQYKRITGRLPADWKDRPAVKYTKKILKSFQEIDKSKYGTPEPAVTDEPLPILGPKVLESIQAEYGAKDRHSTKIPDPSTIEKDMERFPSFWEEVPSLPKNITDAWMWEDFLDFGTKYTTAMIKLAWSYRNMECTSEEEYEEPKDMDTSGTGVVEEKPVEAAKPAASVPTPAPRGRMQMLKRKTG